MTAAYFYSSTAGSYTLTGAISNSATSLVVSSVTGLPSSTPYKVVLDPGQGSEEIVKVTGVAGTTLTVVRAWDGTSASSHAAGATVRHAMTAEDLALARAHEDATVAHGATGAVVGTTNVQSLTNKDLTAGTNTFPSSLVTLTGAQTLTNKNLTSGTNTFPTSLVTLTGSQTLSSKTLNAPILTGAATASRLDITNNIDTSTIPLTVNGIAGQVSDIFVVRDSGSNLLMRATAFDAKSGSASFPYAHIQGLLTATDRTVASATIPAVDVRGVLVKGIASQTANFLEARDSTGTVKWAVAPDGSVISPNTADSGWQNVTIGGGFAGQTTQLPQVRKVGNQVNIRGGWNNTGLTANAEIAVGTIPVGYRPALLTLINMVGSTGNQYGMAVINTSGAVSIRTGSAVADYYLFPGELDGWFVN